MRPRLNVWEVTLPLGWKYPRILRFNEAQTQRLGSWGGANFRSN